MTQLLTTIDTDTLNTLMRAVGTVKEAVILSFVPKDKKDNPNEWVWKNIRLEPEGNGRENLYVRGKYRGHFKLIETKNLPAMTRLDYVYIQN